MSRAVFTSKQKLIKAIEFKRVFKKPVVTSDACFKVLARVGENSGPRLGMAVSRQVDKKAVGRNRIRGFEVGARPGVCTERSLEEASPRVPRLRSSGQTA